MFLFRRRHALFAFLATMTVTSATFFSGCSSAPISLVKTDASYGLSYAVVVSKATYADADWKAVTDFLVQKRNATLIVYENSVDESRDALAQKMPRYTAFVAKPEECGRDAIAAIHRLTRQLDGDPYLDTQWGVITGSNAENAMRVATAAKPLDVQRALATTALDEELFKEYFLLSDTPPAGSWLWKKADGAITRGRNNLPKNEALTWAEQLEQTPFDLIVTGARGSENSFEMPFARGVIRAIDGHLHAFADPKQQTASGDDTLVTPSLNPKIYFPVTTDFGGLVSAPHCMVTAMMGANGVNQIAGYTVTAWFGRGGRDTLDLWQAFPARATFAECFFLNQQRLIHDIAKLDPNALEYKIPLGAGEVTLDKHLKAMVDMGLKFDPKKFDANNKRTPNTQLAGLLWDIDTLAFFGDPAWKATFEPSKDGSFMTAGIVSDGDTHTLAIKIVDSARFMANNAPVGIPFTTRLGDVKVISGQQYEPVVADNFILVLNPKPQAGENEIIVKFSGKPVQ